MLRNSSTMITARYLIVIGLGEDGTS